MRNAIALVLLALTVGCQFSEPSAPARFVPVDGAVGANAVALAPVFGPVRLQRATGKPAVETHTVSTKGFKAPFRLVVENGEGPARVSSAIVRVDGRQLMGPADFNAQVEKPAEFEVAAGATMVLEVEVRGAPGSALTVTLLGQRAATRFCPTDPSAFSSFHKALAATEPGSTIEICDGHHTVAEVVNRPVTIVAEHAGMATLSNPYNAAVFQVAGVAAGTVRIADLNFDAALAGVLVYDAYDTVIVENSAFRSTLATGAPYAVRALPSTGPAPKPSVIIRGNRIEGFREGLSIAAVLHADVAGNTIVNSTLNGITWRHGGGTVRGNTFEACGVNACIDVWRAALGDGSPVEVADNAIDNDISRNTGRSVTVQGLVHVRRNRVTGHGGLGVPATFPIGLANFAVRAGAIMIVPATGFVPVIEDNEISNAWFGVEMIRARSGLIVRNNKISGVAFVFGGFELTDVTVERNDAWNYAGAMNVNTVTGSFRCNWWGSASGPMTPLFALTAPPELWTPYATTPIAGRPEVACP
jgi:hypothetical protein